MGVTTAQASATQICRDHQQLVLFAAHDPSAKNHLRPLYKAFAAGSSPLAQRYCTNWQDLALPGKLAAPGHLLSSLPKTPTLVLVGNSVNARKSEYALVAAARARGILAAQLVEFGPGGLRLPPDGPASSFGATPDHFLVGSRSPGR